MSDQELEKAIEKAVAKVLKEPLDDLKKGLDHLMAGMKLYAEIEKYKNRRAGRTEKS